MDQNGEAAWCLPKKWGRHKRFHVWSQKSSNAFFFEKQLWKFQKLTKSSSQEYPRNTCCWLQIFLVTKAPERRRNSGHPTGTTYGFRGVIVMTSHHDVLFNLSGFNHFWLQINMKMMVKSASFWGEMAFSIPHLRCIKVLFLNEINLPYHQVQITWEHHRPFSLFKIDFPCWVRCPTDLRDPRGQPGFDFPLCAFADSRTISSEQRSWWPQKCHRFIMISMIFCDSQDIFDLFEKSMFVESQPPAGHEHNLAKEAAQSGCCQRPQVGIGGTGATTGAWTNFGKMFVLTTKAIVDSSFKTLGMCHLKVFHKLRALIWRLPRTKSLLKLVPAQNGLIWMMFWSIFFWFTLFFITCNCRILFSHQLFSFDLAHCAELCFQGQWWVGGMTSDRSCWLKGFWEIRGSDV